MSAKFLLYVSRQQAITALWRSGAVTACETLDNDEAGWQTFATLLKTHPHVPVYILVDTVDEDYRTETLPHTSGKTRSLLLKRKLAQNYRGSAFTVAEFQGRVSDGRHDDIYLLAALTKADVLHPWLDLIQQHNAPLQGIYLLPQVSEWLLPHLELPDHDLLLVSRHNAGLRQSYFSGGRLKLSRLTPLEQAEPDAVTLYVDEIEKTRFYLNSLRLLDKERALAVYLLDHDAHFDSLATALAQDPAIHCRRLDTEQLRSRLKPAVEKCRLCPIYPHLLVLGRAQTCNSIAPASLLQPYRLHTFGKALYFAAGGVLVAGALIAGALSLAAGRLTSEQTNLIAATASLSNQYDVIARAFPRAPVSAEELVTTVQRVQQLQQNRPQPEPFMDVISRALKNHPEIRLNRLEWQAGQTNPGSTDNRSPAMTGGSIDALLNPFSGDYRAAMSQIESFAAALQDDPRVSSVKITRLPLNLDPTAALHGTTQDRSIAAGASEFSIFLQLKG